VPSRWEVTLAGPSDAPVPLAAPLAVVSGWLDGPASGPGNGSSGHDDQGRRWACGPLRTVASGPDGTADTVLGVRLLDDALGDRLTRAAVPGRPVRLGAGRYVVARSARLVEHASWAQLRQWSGARAWQVRFVTPACVRRGGRTSPWLAPESLARSLAERWRRLDSATAPPLPRPGSGPVWVSDIDGHSQAQILTRHARPGGRNVGDEVISGFIGRIRYVCDRGTDAEAADFDALMSFARFAGAGSHTTAGFGVMVAEPTWQPPTTRAAQP
jgi:CRISPR-associated endoribonuclease Cas6